MNYTIWHFHATIHKQGFHRCLILDLIQMMCDSPIVNVYVDDEKKNVNILALYNLEEENV